LILFFIQIYFNLYKKEISIQAKLCKIFFVDAYNY